MADRLTAEQRSRCMSQVRGRDTQPERLLRKALHAAGYRYRLNDRSMPGSPDLSFRALRAAIFVHGCFWHLHRCRRGALPKSRQRFWSAKLLGNRERDERVKRELRRMGWRVYVVWECRLRTNLREELCRVETFLEGAKSKRASLAAVHEGLAHRLVG